MASICNVSAGIGGTQASSDSDEDRSESASREVGRARAESKLDPRRTLAVGTLEGVRHAFPPGGFGEPNEAGVRPQLGQTCGVRIAHAGAEAADELVQDVRQWTLVRYD